MSEFKLSPGSLVLYKSSPARVVSLGEKIGITLPGGKDKRVRDKDISPLHPGPVSSLDALDAGTPNIEEAWELLEGEEASLSDLAELLYGDFTPATAWSSWQLVTDGLYFEDEGGRIRPRSAEQVAAEQAQRQAKQNAEHEWDAFIARVRAGALEEADRKRLAEVERVALGTTERSRILQALEVPENPESAHRFLVHCGYWGAEHNPHPLREGAQLGVPELAVPELPQEQRVDLTHLPAFAIDDEGNQDPDDAISIDGERIWVHVADVAALVAPDSELDLAARGRSANLYLPEAIHPMLPPAITHQLGLGLAEESPALSIGFRYGDGELSDIEVVPSRVRVTRTTYEAAESMLDTGDLGRLRLVTDDFRAARKARGAASINLPEVSIRVIDDEVEIRPLPKLNSRSLVTDAMLMAGEAVARLAMAEGIAIPYAIQPPPDKADEPQSMAESYAYRRFFKASKTVMEPGLHAGLGLEAYTRTTSPLRRYQDLVTHQQLRALATGTQPLSQEQIAERIAAANAVTGIIRRSERNSNLHWKLVYLQRNPKWEGDAVVVGLTERKAAIIIPELAFETRIRLQEGMALDQTLRLQLAGVDLPAQTAHFRVL